MKLVYTGFVQRKSSLASPVVGLCSEKHDNAMEWADPSLLSVICVGAEFFDEQATSSAAINLMAEQEIS